MSLLSFVSAATTYSRLFRSCIVFDDAICHSDCTEVSTYSEVLKTSSVIACLLHKVLANLLNPVRGPVVAVYANLCPAILSVIISILFTPAVYCPVSTNLRYSQLWNALMSCGASVVIVHISLIEEFLAMPELMGRCSELLMQFVQYGIVVAVLNDQLQLRDSISRSLCTPLTACDSCTKILMSFNNIQGENVSDKAEPQSSPFILSSSQSIACALHTSGSTGTPKKVFVPHSCIASNIVDLKARFGMSAEDRVFNAAPLTFDPSIVEIFLSLSCGACLVAVPDIVKATPSLLSRVLVERQKVTMLQITPSVFYQLSEAAVSTGLLGEFSFLRVLAFGGETCPGLSSLARWKSVKNQTRIFNLYGITEVSCWATCHEVNPLSLSTHTSSNRAANMVPIGECLLDTCIELRDQSEADGGIEGSLWIGGCSRVCLINGETEFHQPTWRNSGDVAFKDIATGSVYIVGRTDRQIKRKGHRVNMDYVQQIISSVMMVFSCCVINVPIFSDSHVFVVTAVIVPIKDLFDLKELFVILNKLLPNSHIPDKFVFVDRIPTNAHGKCDIKSLLDLLKRQKEFHQPSCSIEKVYLTGLILECTRIVLTDKKEEIAGDEYCLQHSLSELSATSFDVVRISNLLEDRLAEKFSGSFDAAKWFELLLTKPLKEVINLMYDSYKLELVCVDKRKKRVLSLQSTENKVGEVSKVPKLEVSIRKEKPSLKTYRRGIITLNGRLLNQCVFPIKHHQLLSLHKLWSVPTGKCVDSSPLVVTVAAATAAGSAAVGSSLVYVGSHSGILLALSLKTGAVLWRTQLPDRLESSPCVTVCGCYIVIGCYNGCVYVLGSESGSVEWCFQTDGMSSGEPVKSSPVVSASNGWVWFGSHDKHVYSIDVYNRRLVYKVYLDGGSCFSSPAVSDENFSVYIGTLKGNMFAINTGSGQIRWCYSCPRPIFSSPTVLSNGDVLFGCVDGRVYIINSFGEQIHVLRTNEAVFSSCVVSSTETVSSVYVGSHDNHMYCWNKSNDEQYHLKWKCNLESPVYSTCMLTNFSGDVEGTLNCYQYSEISQGTMEMNLICVCSCNGVVYLIAPHDGTVIESLKLPGEVFSSPTIVNDRVVVGCRDESVYCLHICKS